MSAVPATPAAGPAWAAPLRARWLQFAPRERLALSVMAWAFGIVLGWMLLISPALKTLREAPAKQLVVDAQFDEMRRLADEARGLGQQPRLPPAQAVAALNAAVKRLGDKARLQMEGDRATVTLQGIPGSELTAFLAEIRAGARARPLEAKLLRNAAQGYDGTLVLALAVGL